MGIKIEDDIFVYKLFDKKIKFPFLVVCVCYLSSNIPSSVFYGSILSGFLKIAACTLALTDFMPEASQLYTRMVTQVRIKASLNSQDTLKYFPSIVRHMTT